MTTKLPYSLNVWESRPHTNDDCNTGKSFATEAEARAALANPEIVSAWFGQQARMPGNWLELTGPGLSEISKNPESAAAARRRAAIEEREARAWRKEMAREAGMAFGADAYNDAMGW